MRAGDSPWFLGRLGKISRDDTDNPYRRYMRSLICIIEPQGFASLAYRNGVQATRERAEPSGSGGACQSLPITEILTRSMLPFDIYHRRHDVAIAITTRSAERRRTRPADGKTENWPVTQGFKLQDPEVNDLLQAANDISSSLVVVRDDEATTAAVDVLQRTVAVLQLGLDITSRDNETLTNDFNTLQQDVQASAHR